MAKKTPRKKLVATLDKLFSLAVRAKAEKNYGGCFFDGKPIEHCFHFVTRSKHSVRWDFTNAEGSCAGCNFRMEFDPHPYIQWYIRKHGLPAYEDLIRRSNERAGFSLADLEKRVAELKAVAN